MTRQLLECEMRQVLIESRLGGAGVWDVLLPAGEAIDGKMLGDMTRLGHRLRLDS